MQFSKISRFNLSNLVHSTIIMSMPNKRLDQQANYLEIGMLLIKDNHNSQLQHLLTKRLLTKRQLQHL